MGECIYGTDVTYRVKAQRSPATCENRCGVDAALSPVVPASSFCSSPTTKSRFQRRGAPPIVLRRDPSETHAALLFRLCHVLSLASLAAAFKAMEMFQFCS